MTWCGESASTDSARKHEYGRTWCAKRLTNNDAELTALLAALTWRATLPGWVRVRIVSDNKVSIELVERRARALTNTALVQQCRHVLTMCRAVASIVFVHTYSH